MTIWAKLLIVLALAGVIGGVHMAYSSHYIDVGRDQVTAENAEQKRVDNEAATTLIAAANARAKSAGELLAAKSAEFETNRAKENINHENALKNERKRALAGTSGLRCPGIAANQTGTVGPGEDRPATGRTGDEKGTDLVPGAADAILSIASDSAKLVRDYNEVVDLYDAARKACSTGR